MILLFSLLFSFGLRADIQQRISFFTQQSDLLRQVCFLPDGTFLADRILFDVRSTINETAFDCNAQALALKSEYEAIEAFTNSPQCPIDQRVDNQGLVDLLNGNAGIVEELSCPGIGSAADCSTAFTCNLVKSIIPTGHAIANYFSDHPVLSSCEGTGSCFSSLGTAIWHNLWDTVKGLYNLGEMGVNWVGEQIGSLWRAEDATSSRGIAATEATDSQLDQFVRDPLGYLADMSNRLLSMIYEGIQNRYGCAEWTGLPHVSECAKPMSWECADCNEKTNMVCGVAGYIGANIVTNFFTGGAVAGVQIAGRVARAATFTVARNVPGGARLLERMSTAGRIGRLGSLVGGTIRNTWAAVAGSRTVTGLMSVAGRVNNAARKQIFLYAQGQDAAIAAARAYNRMTLGAFRAGYASTHRAAENTRAYLFAQYPKLSDITAGRYANVSNVEQYRREVTKNMSPEDRMHMRVTVTSDANGQRRVVVHDTRAGTLRTDVAFDFNPAVRPVVVARAVPEEIATVDEIVVVGRRGPRVPPTREEYVERWSDQIATSPSQNRTYIDEALRGEQPGVFFVDTQNTALKRLNDTLRDKSMVDAVGNRYNDLMIEAIEEFRIAHPGVEINMYSDYKSFRASIRGPPGQEDELMAELGQIMSRTEQTFLNELRASNLVEESMINERWFRAGMGRTSDEANLVTRFSRRETDLTPTTFSTARTQARIRNAWELAEQSRDQLARRFSGSPLLRPVEGTSRQIPSAEVLEVVRKTNGPDEIARILSGRYGTQVTRADAELLQEYFTRVDQFSPGLLIPSRVEHRFDEAVNGGFSIDFAGVGSVNAEATAAGLARGTTLQDSIRSVRQSEIVVTRELDALKARTETAVRDVLTRRGIAAEITVSGDDMIVIPNRALTPEIRREIAEAQVAAQAGTSTLPSGMRTSFFREGIPDQAARSIQATIGESIEKKLRSRLEGQIPRDEMRQTLFAIEMRGTSAGSGGVDLNIVNPNLSPASRQLIERELRNAIEDVNTELRGAGQGGSLMRESGQLKKRPEAVQAA